MNVWDVDNKCVTIIDSYGSKNFGKYELQEVWQKKLWQIEVHLQLDIFLSTVDQRSRMEQCLFNIIENPAAQKTSYFAINGVHAACTCAFYHL